jgi:hypothetical protein
MKVGDLVRMRGGLPAMGIVLRQRNGEVKGFTPIGGVERPTIKRVEVYWIEDAESSWEPVKWLEAVNPS